ncbi:enterochelin esterase, partial [Streptomyces sp. UH6]|uniref:enterochelin esterase n=1 Tax=Streptomyces sp. UH6 TaxID=2748379 RepID=UPI0027D278D6
LESRPMSFPAPPPESLPHPPRTPRPAAMELADSPRVAALEAGAESTEAFWDSVRATGTPLVEPDPQGSPDHVLVTFLWRGDDRVRAALALPNKLADPRDPAANLMRRVPGTDVWHWTLRMRTDWQATYSICVDDGDDPHAPRPGERTYWQWLRSRPRVDPFNPRTLPRRWGGVPQSVLQLPAAPTAEHLWRSRPGVARGTVTEHRLRSELLGNERRVWLYEPAPPQAPGPARATGADAGPGAGREAGLPVVVLFDAEMWQPELDVAALLDNLIAGGALPPVAAVMPESLGSERRYRELAPNEAFVEFLRTELLPWAGKRLPLTDDPARTVVAGQSLGGLAAVYAAVSAPGRFGNALSCSGSFWWPNHAETDGEWITGAIREHGVPDGVRIRLASGAQEWVLLPATDHLCEALAERGAAFSHRRFNGGHDYLCWRTELADGLTELLGRPAPRG